MKKIQKFALAALSLASVVFVLSCATAAALDKPIASIIESATKDKYSSSSAEAAPSAQNSNNVTNANSNNVTNNINNTYIIQAPTEKTSEEKNSSISNDNTFTDTRDGQKYKMVKIGKQTWMAENLNYKAKGSKCYESQNLYCDKYGRMYNWNTAIATCPNGWHLPTDTEWDKLINFVDGTNGTKSNYTSEIAGKYLKAKESWNDNDGESGNGEDKFGFAALPGGESFIIDPLGGSGSIGYFGCWWSATEGPSDKGYLAYHWCMFNSREGVYYREANSTHLFSVRCIKD